MDNRHILKECAENLALLTQLGVSIAAPPLVCLYAAAWLRGRYSLGIWIMAVGLLLGVGGGAMNAWKFWRMIRKRFQRGASDSSGSGESGNIGGEEYKD